MEYLVNQNGNSYKVVAEKENDEQNALIIKALESFESVKENYESAKFEYDQSRGMLEKMFGKGFDEYGLKSVKGRYTSITYVPATEARVEKTMVMNETKVRMLMDKFGISEDKFMDEVDKEVGARKASVRIK